MDNKIGLSDQRITIWYGAFADIADQERYRWHWALLDKAERARALRYKNPLLRERYVEVHGRLRQALAQLVDEKPEKLAIKQTAHGKPYLCGFPLLAFNLSHSGKRFIIAAGFDCQLGIDIEDCRPRSNLAALSRRCFAQEEIIYWSKLNEQAQTVEFYRFWTRKEAFVKAVGRGLALGLNQCVVNPENPSRFLRLPKDYGSAASWLIYDIELEPAFCCALVVDKAVSRIEFAEIDDVKLI